MIIKPGTPTVATAATAVIAAMFAALLILLGLWLHESYSASVRRIEERATAAAKIVATNVAWIDALAWQALQRIDDSLGPDIGIATDTVRDINGAVADLPGGVQAYVVDRNGNTLYSTDPAIKPMNITDRPYFSELARGATTHVSNLLVSRLTGEQIFVFSRRLDRKGEFAGVATVAFQGKVLAAVWETVDLGEGSTVGIIRRDGQLVARYPAPAGPLDMSKYTLFTDLLPDAPSGTYQAVSPADGVSRIVGYTVVEGTDFVAVGSAERSAGMVRFWNDVFIAGTVLLLAVVGLLAAGAWIKYLLSIDAAKSERLTAALDENQLLMREIHHRVKNNFQSVQSLIRTQQLPKPMQQSLLDRIAAMVAVHEQIYSRDQFTTVSTRELIPAVVDKLLIACGDRVSVSYELENIDIAADHATPLALLTNEVVTNALKYAFPNGRSGVITVALRSLQNKRACLVIADNGVGFDKGAAVKGMGMRIVEGVVGQLRGEFLYERRNGTVFTAEIEIHE
ncbi:putative sensor histidine kinase pdtaS [Ensifer sp. M14]|uniref:sensor histidine kinase n=1 Tax=Ensifer sp. M14 TaxID=2203782 RepID=UPI000E1D578A|nr:cache domain-containing protein [Ensifer sp. M14]RDL47912.1 putative sensor histidine kinase pdtaS [Ensifer sp. M14]